VVVTNYDYGASTHTVFEGRAWKMALINITKATMSIDIQFEYDNPTHRMPNAKSLDMSQFAF